MSKFLDSIIGISMVIETLGLKRENLRRIYKMREEVNPKNNIYVGLREEKVLGRASKETEEMRSDRCISSPRRREFQE